MVFSDFGDAITLPDNRQLAREDILNRVRDALDQADRRIVPCPRFSLPAVQVENGQTQLGKLLKEIDKLGGTTRIIHTRNELKDALEDLVSDHGIRRAVLWPTKELIELNIPDILQDLGITLISPYSVKLELAECDLGVTGADQALPDTGTLLLSASIDHPPVVSLLPRIHLVVLDASAFRDSLEKALLEVRRQSAVCITGPSRTADIEMTIAIGVHGPRVLVVWALVADFK